MARFKPGQSGNPGGRPKGVSTEANRILENINGLQILAHIACGNNPKTTNADRIAALDRLMDRAWGKAPNLEAHLMLDARDGGQRAEIVRGALETLARALGGAPTIDALPEPVDATLVDAAPAAPQSATQSAVVADQQDPKPE